ncbi:MAG: Uncharacterized protein LiPW15_586 [Parcubacteria group bacterium LiPW_15]|nr:MAG: Uncharacterized protein LiPW15_586 [Parcubacteria group bacterium LiPW_15]
MIFFLYGADGYRRLKRKQAITAELKKKYPDLVIGKFSLENEESIRSFLDFAKGQSLFSGKRLCFLEDIDMCPAKETKELLFQFLEPKDVAVIVADQTKPAKGVEFLTKNPAHAEEFGELSGPQLLSFIKVLAKERGARLSPGAERKLAALYGKDTWGLATEIEKIASFDPKLADEGRVEGLGVLPEGDYWPMLNSLKGRDISMRLQTLSMLSARREDPAKTFNILAAATKPQAARFAEYDVLIKSGKMDYPEALLDFVLAG